MEEWAFGATRGDLIRDYHRDPFPHSLLRARQKMVRTPTQIRGPELRFFVFKGLGFRVLTEGLGFRVYTKGFMV